MARDIVVQDNLYDQESTGYTHSALDFLRLDQYCQEIREQPPFRAEQDKCCDYYDGNQMTREQLAENDEKGIGNLITNLVKPTVDVVLGMEAKTRSDWRVAADGDESQPVAEALSAEIHTMERETRADRACSDAYAGQIKAGLGWVEVSKVANPFAYRYRTSSVHRREMYWDWQRREPDLSDARYLIRKRRYDKDALCAYMPQHANLFRAAGSGWNDGWLEIATQDTTLAQSLEVERGWSVSDYEWRDTIRGHLWLMEVWYRSWCRGYVLKLPDGRVVELNMQNPLHVQAVGRGLLKPEPAVYDKLNRSLWCGPHKLLDIPHRRRSFPYIPFWGFLEDTTGIPYGLIRTMVSPQDEVNARKQKMYWLLNAKRLTMDSDALDSKFNTVADVLKELGRPDGAILLNPQRANKQGGISVDHNGELSEQQYKALLEAKDALQQAAGVYQAMLGSTESGGATAGVAIQSLVEQGTITLAEVNDNYRYARRAVGEEMLELRRADLVGQQVNVQVGEDPKKRIISLNTPKKDPASGVTYRDNDVERAKLKVALEDVPSTPAYRQQIMTMLAEVMKGMPPQLQAFLTPFYIESTELPKRRQIAETMRRMLNLPDLEGDDGNEDPRVKELMAKIAEMEQMIVQLQNAPAVKESEAKVEKLGADADLARARTAQIQEQTVGERPKRDLEVARGALDLAQATEQPAQAAEATA